jgi:hypothetical protein
VKRVVLALALTAGLVLPAHAQAGTVFGVTEDAGKYSSDGGAAFFARLRDLGMSENAVSVQWDPDRPNAIVERALLDRVVPNASQSGIRLVFAVYFSRPTAVSASANGAADFAHFLRTLARTYPQVKDFVVGNEPNYGVFWQPQFGSDGTPAAGAAYEDVLARSYDALKSVDPRINVIGFGLAARGNDDPGASSPSTSPVLFLRDVGDAYRRSGRTRPLMDSFAYHPYPASSLSSPATKQSWPSAGVADLSRVKQAVWDAFHDTPQATFERGLALKITEIGWQAEIPAGVGSYHGAENVRTTDEATQAQIYARLIRELACDPSVADVLFFHLVDEPDLRGFQSGLIRADGSLRPAYTAVQQAIAETGGKCAGSLTQWRHSESVVGGAVSFGRPGDPGSVSVTAQEAATYHVAYARVQGPPTDAERTALEESVQQPGAAVVTGSVPAYGRVAPELEAPKEAGTYVEALLVSAAVDGSRTSFFLSEPFTVGEAESDAAGAAPSAPAAPAVTDERPAPAEQGPRFAVARSAGRVSTVPSAGRVSTAPSIRQVSVPPLAPLRPPARTARFSATRTSYEFRTQADGEAPAPHTSDLSPPERAAAGPAASTPRGVALDAYEPKGLPPLLFALLLVGAGLSAVLAIRLLSR